MTEKLLTGTLSLNTTNLEIYPHYKRRSLITQCRKNGSIYIFGYGEKMCHNMTKLTKWPVRPAKTQISLGIRPVWSEPGHPTSLIRVFAVRMKKAWVLIHITTHSDDSKDWSDWLDTQADLSLRWAHRSFVWFFHTSAQNKFAEYEPPHDKTNKMTMRPAKTQISLGTRPVWSESSLPGRMPRLIWVFAGRTCHFVGFGMRRLIS